MDFVTLTSTERIASNSRVVAMFLSVAPAVLLSAGFCCTIGWCLSATCMGVMLAVAVGVAVALGALGVLMAAKKAPPLDCLGCGVCSAFMRALGSFGTLGLLCVCQYRYRSRQLNL